MKILVINAGSSSLKYQLFEMDDESVVAKGICEKIGLSGSTLTYKGKQEFTVQEPMHTHSKAIEQVLNTLVNPAYGVIKNLNEIAAVGHRVLISADKYNSSVVVDDAVLENLVDIVDLGPLHMPANLMGIRACRKAMPHAPMVAVFDNTFHSTMPDYAYTYAIPYDDAKKYKIRKYGFHGTSHLYVAGEAARILGKKDFKLIICHLGNGASVSAVKDGICMDTSMGLTPLEGLVMGTRSGDIDPAVIEYLMDKTGMDIHEATDYLNKKSGVLGVSGISSDFRDLETAAAKGNDRAQLALNVFCYRVKKYIGSYAAALGGVDCIAFTGGIGENSAEVRGQILEGLEFLGINFDAEANKNAARGKISILSKGNVKIYVIPTNEELVIARETQRLAQR